MLQCTKKMIFIFLGAMLYVLIFPLTVHAGTENDVFPQASDYIRCTSVNITPQGNGRLLVENKLGATTIVDKLGIKTLEIQT